MNLDSYFLLKCKTRWTLLPALGCIFFAVNFMPTTPAQASERPKNQTSAVSFSISVRTPEQIRAFYSGRGFPEAAILELESKCMLTIGLQNKHNDTVWLEPSQWRFTTEHGAEVNRISREEIARRWEQLNIPLASRATFGWSQLPESRDLFPGEGAGGNILIIPPADSFSVEAIFATGTNKTGATIKLKTALLKCGNTQSITQELK